MSDFASSAEVILKNVRLDFFDVYTKGAPIKESDKADPDKWKYKVKAIFAPDSDAYKVASAAFVEAAKGLWGPNFGNVINAMAKNSKAIRKGDENLAADGSVRPEYEGMFFVSGSNKAKPPVVGQKKINGKFVDIDPEGNCFQDGLPMVPPPYKTFAPYRGCYVNLKMQFIAGKAKGDMPNQVYAKFIALQIVGEGVAFGAGPASAEGFGDEEVTEAAGGDLFG